jgi:hypothetical protein
MPDEDDIPIQYATPGTYRTNSDLRIYRRMTIGVGFGLICFGLGWGFVSQSACRFPSAITMGIGGALVGFAAPSLRTRANKRGPR